MAFGAVQFFKTLSLPFEEHNGRPFHLFQIYSHLFVVLLH